MKKIILQIMLIMLVITVGTVSVFISKVNAASIAGINVSAATVGGNFTVSLILPSEAYGVESTITVTYSDGSKSSQRLVYVSGMSDFQNAVSFPAKVAGTAQISATGIIITDKNSNFIENGGTKEQTITIQGNTPTANPPAVQNNNASNTGNNKNPVEKQPEVVNPTFKEVNETVYALQGCNVRSSCSSEISSNKIGGLTQGQSVTRTGIDSNWSRIVYNGKTAYVATRLLTNEKPATVENTVANTTNTTNTTNTVNNTVSNNTVSNEISREEMLNQIQNEIGVLPEVGNNIAVTLFRVISMVTIAGIMYVYYKLKNQSI